MFLACAPAYNRCEFDITRTTSASPAHRHAFASNATSHPVLVPREGTGQPARARQCPQARRGTACLGANRVTAGVPSVAVARRRTRSGTVPPPQCICPWLAPALECMDSRALPRTILSRRRGPDERSDSNAVVPLRVGRTSRLREKQSAQVFAARRSVGQARCDSVVAKAIIRFEVGVVTKRSRSGCGRAAETVFRIASRVAL
jgi:hypothetical protein